MHTCRLGMRQSNRAKHIIAHSVQFSQRVIRMPLTFLLSFLPSPDCLHPITNPVLGFFPQRPIEFIAELSVTVDFAPAIPPPLTAGHIYGEIPVLLLIVKSRVNSTVRASSGRKATDFALR